MSATRLFVISLEREIDADDRAALEQAAIDVLAVDASEGDGGQALHVRAPDEDAARLRVHAALGGSEPVHVRHAGAIERSLVDTPPSGH